MGDRRGATGCETDKELAEAPCLLHAGFFEQEGVPEEIDLFDSTDGSLPDAEPIQQVLDRVLDPEHRLEESTNGWDTYMYYIRPDVDEESAILEAVETLPSMYEGEPYPGWYLEHKDEIIILQCVQKL